MADMSTTQFTVEVLKIATSITTPLLVAVVGFRLNRTLHGLAAAQWANQKAVEKKIVVFDQVAPGLNDLYCYMVFVGNWKELRPPDIISLKRKLDRSMHIYAALFSPDLMTAYYAFMDRCFETYVAAAQDARVRTTLQSANGDRRQVFADWKSDWEKLFSPNPSSRDDVRASYHALMEIFSSELGVRIHRTQAPPLAAPRHG